MIQDSTNLKNVFILTNMVLLITLASQSNSKQKNRCLKYFSLSTQQHLTKRYLYLPYYIDTFIDLVIMHWRCIVLEYKVFRKVIRKDQVFRSNTNISLFTRRVYHSRFAMMIPYIYCLCFNPP